MNRVRNLLLLVVLAACAFSFWWARRGPASDGASLPPLPRHQSGETAPPPLLSIHVSVLNGTGEPGLARRYSRQMSEHGCVVVDMADAPHDTFSRSLLVNRRLGDDQAAQLASRLGGMPVVREWDPRCREDAVVVLGHDHGRYQASSVR